MVRMLGKLARAHVR